MRHHLLVLAARVVVAAALDAADPARVQPVVCADGDGHEAEGGERAHRRHEHLDAAVTHQHLHIGGSLGALILLYSVSSFFFLKIHRLIFLILIQRDELGAQALENRKMLKYLESIW